MRLNLFSVQWLEQEHLFSKMFLSEDVYLSFRSDESYVGHTNVAHVSIYHDKTPNPERPKQYEVPRMTTQYIADSSGDVRNREVRVFLPGADGTKSTTRRYIK